MKVLRILGVLIAQAFGWITGIYVFFDFLRIGAPIFYAMVAAICACMAASYAVELVYFLVCDHFVAKRSPKSSGSSSTTIEV